MSWTYTKDNRTDSDVAKDYNMGKSYERLIFNRLPKPKFALYSNDRFKVVSSYSPDCFIQIRGKWRPVEIKYSKFELNYVELKENQALSLAKLDGIYLQSTPTRYCFIDPKELVKNEKVIGYCNKPCFRLNNPEWSLWITPLDRSIDYAII